MYCDKVYLLVFSNYRIIFLLSTVEMAVEHMMVREEILHRESC